MRKIVHLHKRRPGTDVESFHAGLAASAADPAIPDLAGYAQSHTLVKGYAKGELLFDAVEEFSFLSDEAADAFPGSDHEREIAALRSPLVGRGGGWRMTIDVHRVKDCPVPADAVKNIEFVNRRPGMDLGAFGRYWRAVHGPLGSRIPSILRYEQNHLVLDAYRDGSRASTASRSPGSHRRRQCAKEPERKPIA